MVAGMKGDKQDDNQNSNFLTRNPLFKIKRPYIFKDRREELLHKGNKLKSKGPHYLATDESKLRIGV